MPRDIDDELQQTPGPGDDPDREDAERLSPREMLKSVYQDVKHVRRNQAEMSIAIYGPRNRPSEGLLTQVHDLRKAETTRKKMVWVAVCAAIVSVVGMAKSIIVSGFSKVQ